jgi:N-acetylneuraminic acid mutarotase
MGMCTSTLQRYNVTTDTWAVLTPMPTARCSAAAATVGNAIYVIGGRTGTAPLSGMALNVVERYDIDTDTWSTVTPIPVPRSDATAITAGGKIYVFGGWNGLAIVGNVDIYDPVTDTWSSGTPMPQIRALHMSARIGNQVYVFGGAGPALIVNGANQVYNITKDTWATDTAMTIGREVGETGVYSHGCAIYVAGGGRPAFGMATNFTQVFRP